MALRSKAELRRVVALAHAAAGKLANERAEAYRIHIEWALRQPGSRGGPISFNAAAKRLNERNIESALGGRWRGHQVQRVAARLGLHHPLAYVKADVARAKVQALWQSHPEYTIEQVIDSVGGERRLGVSRVRNLLRVYRRTAAERSVIHKTVGWRIDNWTPARIRVAALWKQNPAYTAQEALQKLGPRYGVSVQWVRQVLHECWRETAKHTAREGKKGRRCFGRYYPRKAK